ncbi:hypothetical protein [Actinomadura madurae]|uniref:hypothetical protein n=1 Tax=Actinomadura madurae TaxID=1993 RepID=UPI0020D21F0A|nr:hypothetical protein [Actinomadura madurae]MCP9982454.1 hypothetical protein [Actinomadura madurae]MCQ0006019.1 hypothetical protein [Actinomadura madurae]
MTDASVADTMNRGARAFIQAPSEVPISPPAPAHAASRPSATWCDTGSNRSCRSRNAR